MADKTRPGAAHPAPHAIATPADAVEAEMKLPHGSKWPIIAAFGIALLYFGVAALAATGSFLLFGVGVLVILVAIGGIVEEDERWWSGNVGTGLRNGWWGVLFLLGTEVMLFAALFATFFNHRAAAPAWPPVGAPDLPVVKTGINTVILLLSGVTMHWAHSAIRKGDQKQLKIGLVLTILLGLVFIGGQALEYTDLMHEGLTVQSGTYGATFFMLTGTHGAHVIGGLGILAICAVRAFRGQFDQKRHVAVEVSAIYWHFVDVVWVLLYAVVYLRIL